MQLAVGYSEDDQQQPYVPQMHLHLIQLLISSCSDVAIHRMLLLGWQRLLGTTAAPASAQPLVAQKGNHDVDGVIECKTAIRRHELIITARQCSWSWNVNLSWNANRQYQVDYSEVPSTSSSARGHLSLLKVLVLRR